MLAVGDSLLRIATPAIHAQLDSSYRVEVIAHVGERIDELLAPLEHALKASPRDAVIVQLGTNDAIQGAAKHPRWEPGWDRLVRDVLPVRCVVFTTVSTYLDREFHDHVPELINARIARLHETHANVHVVDWNGLIHAPHYAAVKKYMSGVPGQLDTDGIHENNGAGAQWFARQYRQALGGCL